MVELREETGVQRRLTEKLVRSRLQWAGHVERMAVDRLPTAGGDEGAKTEMGGLCLNVRKAIKRGGRLEEEDNRQRRVEKTIR